MVRVLQVYPQMNNAGTERVIFNLYENIDTSAVQFDFLVEKPGEMDEKIRNMGGNIYYMYEENNNQYYKKLYIFLKEHPEYRVVHTHTHARMGTVLKAAKRCGIPCRIAHSHNARNDLPGIAAFVKGLTSIPMEQSANYFFACSGNAAKWLFPHRVKKCKVLYNGIKLQNYLFDGKVRINKRKELGIREDDFVMIHVGRFAKQKNHAYLIDILEKYRENHADNWKMLMVGVGPLQDEIKKRAEEKGLSEYILFLNNRTDVNELLSASDLFVFPSLHEGLGIVVIEAQASGLPCIVSDAVPPEADMEIGLLQVLSIQSPAGEWADCIEKSKKSLSNREENKTKILAGKYNIETIAGYMQEFYLEHGKLENV